MNLFPEHIILEDNPLAVSDFINHNKTGEGLKHDLAVFLAEWYSPGNHISVKTSGSTGTPKTIGLRKDFVAESALRTLRFFDLKRHDKVLLCLPLQFIAGKLMVVRALLGGLSLHAVDPATGFSFLQQQKFRFAAMVPNQVSKILENEPQRGSWMNSIEQLLTGGSAIPGQVEKQLHDLKTRCFSSYGMTETATHIALRRLNNRDADDWYHCLENIHVKLSDDDCLRIFMPGLDVPFLQTTDIATLRDDKTFRVLGRIDNVIISGGIKFFPEQIEKKLEPHIHLPFVVVPEPHASLGEQLVLVVEGEHNMVLENQLNKICSTVLQRYERPRHIRFSNSIPQTPTGKPDRKKLRR